MIAIVLQKSWPFVLTLDLEVCNSAINSEVRYINLVVYFCCCFCHLRVNVSKYQNSRTRRQVVDFFILCLNKPYGKLFSKNALKGSWHISNFPRFWQNQSTAEPSMHFSKITYQKVYLGKVWKNRPPDDASANFDIYWHWLLNIVQQ